MFKSILVPVDVQEPDFAVPALRYAVGEAHRSGADLHVITVLPGFGMPIVASYFPPDAEAQMLEKAGQILNQIVADHIPEDLKAKLEINVGRRPHEVIASHAKSIGADLIVMVSHHHEGLDGMLLGSCTRRVVEQAPCSVLVLRAQD